MKAATEQPTGSMPPMRRSSLALDNLRAFVILLVLSFHSVLAYLQFLPTAPYPFDSPPYQWRAIAIIDSHRWLGFDLYCAWQDVFLMSLFFFLSGLFVWPSLNRRGAANFLSGRLLRLGLPFVLVVAILMPVTLYPIYLQTTSHPGVAAYWRHWVPFSFLARRALVVLCGGVGCCLSWLGSFVGGVGWWFVFFPPPPSFLRPGPPPRPASLRAS